MIQEGEDKGQSAILVVISLLVLVIFAAITVDISSAYLGRRQAQNAADAAALAAAGELGDQINAAKYNDAQVKEALDHFGELNAVTNVTGVYLDKIEKAIGVIGSGTVPANTQGVEATAHITTPAFFGGVMGQRDYAVQAQAAVMLDLACGGSCIVPIATHYYPFTTTAECYNIWNGGDPGNFGWLNWTWQGVDCIVNPDETCSAECVAENLDPNKECRSGFINVGDWVAGTVGVKNSAAIGSFLESYRITGQTFTVVVWEVTNEKGGCGEDSAGEFVIARQNGLHYRVAGFAEMKVLGYQLPNGNPVPNPAVFDYTKCTTIAPPENGKEKQGFRISTKYVSRAEGEGGRCTVNWGTVLAPTLTQ